MLTFNCNRSNHGTFYVSQTAAIKSYLGDADAAKQDLTNFFNGHFKDQIAASGEQPFEAARTRPYHYRCFNLEALIVRTIPPVKCLQTN